MGGDVRLKVRPPLCEDAPRIRAALTLTGGNITRAAVSLGVGKSYMMGLMRRLALNDFARALRIERGAAATGRPSTLRT